jgi:hypothetical protein
LKQEGVALQNRYIGDVGDYGKFALLRSIFDQERGNCPLRLAIVWCLFSDENHNNDGRHTSYLYKEEFRLLDPTLFDELRALIENESRRVSAIAEKGLFPAQTIFFETHVARKNIRGRSVSALERAAYRAKWLRDCLAFTKHQDVVFFDPDNGVEIASIDKKHPKAGKYVFWDELREFWNRGQSLIIYHHLNRTASVYQQMEALNGRLSREIPGQYRVVRLIFRRGSCRSYWLLLQSDIADLVEERVAKMMQSGWRQHFELI